MLMMRPAVAAICAAGLLSACNVGAMMKADAQREAETDALLADIAAGRDAALLAKMSSKVPQEQVRAQLPFVKTLVPAGPVPQGATNGWQANTGTDGTTYGLTRNYAYPDRVLAVSVVQRQEGEVWKIYNFNINVQMKAPAIPVEVAPEQKADAAA